jgi:hypothetical protein
MMMRRFKRLLVLLIPAIVFQTGCASSTKSLQKADRSEETKTPRAMISEEEIQKEIRPVYRTLYGLGLGLGFGTVGLIGGAKIGYEIAYARDIKRGCEDCGLGGLIYGGLIGGGTGLVGGIIIGQNLGARKDREQAIQRIRHRRSDRPKE